MFNNITCAAVLEHFLQGESKKITSEDWLKLCVQHFRRVVLSRLVSIDRMQADFPLFSGHVSSAVRDFQGYMLRDLFSHFAPDKSTGNFQSCTHR